MEESGCYFPELSKSYRPRTSDSVDRTVSTRNGPLYTVRRDLAVPAFLVVQPFDGIAEGGAGHLGSVEAKAKFSLIGYAQLDLGIAKYHFEVGAGRENFEWA